MPRSPRDIVEIEAYAHATEDPDRVRAAIENILPERFKGNVTYLSEKLEGHYGNPIIVYRVSVENASEEFLLSLLNRMSWEDKASLRRSLDRHIGRHKVLYLRFDKQEAYLGRLRTGYSDSICVRLKLKPHVFKRLPTLLETEGGVAL